jgi:enoyl-CoA hydratase/carnithine racemase
VAIRHEVDQRIAYFSFSRPEKHNAMRDEDLADLLTAIRKFDVDDSADIGILFGQGSSFSSGSDVVHRMQAAFRAGGNYQGPNETETMLQTTNWKPLIAAVDGYCMGQGLGVAFLCDAVVATRSARFQVTEALIGVPTASFVERLGGGRLAIEVGMTGRFFTGEEADRAGLLTKLVDDGEHLTAAVQLAREILNNPQGAVRELVRYRRALLAERLLNARNIAGSYDWASDPDATERILARIGRHE